MKFYRDDGSWELTQDQFDQIGVVNEWIWEINKTLEGPLSLSAKLELKKRQKDLIANRTMLLAKFAEENSK